MVSQPSTICRRRNAIGSYSWSATLGEVIDSQEKMLRRLGREVAPRAELTHAFGMHLARLHRWLAEQPHFAVLRVSYTDVVVNPTRAIDRVNEFLGGRLNVEVACAAVDPSLYRKKAKQQGSSGESSGGEGPDKNAIAEPVTS